MIARKIWWTKRRTGSGENGFETKVSWLREGWFLFGFIPLYVRDLKVIQH